MRDCVSRSLVRSGFSSSFSWQITFALQRNLVGGRKLCKRKTFPWGLVGWRHVAETVDIIATPFSLGKFVTFNVVWESAGSTSVTPNTQLLEYSVHCFSRLLLQSDPLA